MRRVGRLAKSAAKAVAGLTVAAGVVGFAVFKLADSVSKAGDKFAKQAKQIGSSAEALQELSFAAERSGASGDMVVKAMGRMAKAIDDVRVRGTGPLADQLKLLGIGIEEFEGLSPEQAFEKLADVIASVEDPLKRSAIAQDAFGRSGKDLIPLLLEGSKGIAALREEARKHGILTNEQAEQSEILQDKLTNLKATMTGLKNVIGAALIPIVTKYVERLTDWIGRNRDIIAQKMPEIVERIVTLMRQLVPFILKVVEGLNKLIDSFGGLDKAIIVLIGTLGVLKLAALALSGPGGAFAALGIAAVGAGVAMANAALDADEEFQNLKGNIENTRAELQRLRRENRETEQILEKAKGAGRRIREAGADIFAKKELERRLGPEIAKTALGKRAIGAVGAAVRERGISPLVAIDMAIRRVERRLAEPKKKPPRKPPRKPPKDPREPTTEPERARTLQELIGAPASVLGEERQRAPVSISVVNNNFDIDAPISIQGVPGEDQGSLAQRVSDGLRDVLAEAAQNLQPARVR